MQTVGIILSEAGGGWHRRCCRKTAMTSPGSLGRVVVGALALVWVAGGCSSKDAESGPGAGGHGGGAAGAAGTTGAAGSTGAGGTTGAAGSGGTGAGGMAQGGASGAAMVACAGSTLSNSNPGAIANPADFSVNTDTGAHDQHTLSMGRADMFRRIRGYTTGGTADHRHAVELTDAELDSLLGGGTVTVTTSGPPLNASTGHMHTITLRSCGATSGLGGAGG